MTQTKHHFLAFLSVMLTIGVFGIVAMMFFYPIPEGIKDVFNIISGSVVTAWTGVISYWFGSSAGSSKKDDTLGEIAKGNTA